MTDILGNILIELGLFSFLGMLYYFYQKKKILRYEENKAPLVMGLILQSCLIEREETPEPRIDALIEALDDFIQNKTPTPPLALLKIYAEDPGCSPELRDVIREGLQELDPKNEEE
ncbi:MAG TPA: hypothetical protein VNJ01_05985 [Bacteriovoracaceae bacterium]|nr:hypothetical protein [Bacteriovoracaceae bacterium]